MNEDVVLSVALPITLFCIMLSMGINLLPRDFALLFKKPVPVLTGISAQMLLLPAIAYFLLYPLHLPAEIFAGFLILALSPGGTTSNMFSYIAGGNLALSITLTAVVSIITPFSIPLIAPWLLAEQLQASNIHLPFLTTMLKLIVVTLLPVGLGMLLRRLNPEFCQHHTNSITRIPMLMLLLVILGIIRQNWENMPDFLQLTGLPSLLLATFALSFTYLVARGLNQTKTNARTIAIETSIQNGGTAILITGSILHNPAMTIAPVMYGILMLIPVSVFAFMSKPAQPVMDV
jgi:bile acid:Na+ symporter, BASS family